MSTEITNTEVVAISDTSIHVITIGLQGAAGVGMPTGGSAGQTLKKLSGDDFDMAWINEASGTSGQLQYNNAGTLAGVTIGGDATLDTTTGILTLASGINATKIGGGAVSNTEFSYLDGVTSSIQTQLDGKQVARTITGTSNQITVTNGSGVSGNPTLSLPQNIHTAATPQFAKLTLTGSTLGGSSTTDNFATISATMPTTMTTPTYAVNMDITTAGSSAQQQSGLLLTMNSGYTGGSPVNGLQIINNVAGTGANYGSASPTLHYRTTNSNCGLRASCSGITTGINNGGQLLAAGSSVANYGSWCTATSSLNSPALNVGIISTALNATTNCAGMFSLTGSGTPNISNSALIADNGATTGDIFLARDNGTAVLTLSDGGVLNHAAAKINKIRTVTAAGSVTVSATSDHVVEINKSSGAATTVNLPASPATGLTFIIKDGKFDAASNNITLTPASGNINNAATYVITANGGSATIIYNGTQWLVL